MKHRHMLTGLILLAAIITGGCGRKAPVQQSAGNPIAPVEAASAGALQGAHGEADAGDAMPAAALSAYGEILKASPAIEGEHAELADAAFDYARNAEMFGSHYDLFAVTDVDQNGVPELIALSTVNFRWSPVSLYTYADGKAVLLKDPLNPEAHGTFEQMSTAGGAYSTYICAAHHIHSVWRGSTPIGEVEEDAAYALEGTKLTAVNCTAGKAENAIFFSDVARKNNAENVDAMMREYPLQG